MGKNLKDKLQEFGSETKTFWQFPALVGISHRACQHKQADMGTSQGRTHHKPALALCKLAVSHKTLLKFTANRKKNPIQLVPEWRETSHKMGDWCNIFFMVPLPSLAQLYGYCGTTGVVNGILTMSCSDPFCSRRDLRLWSGRHFHFMGTDHAPGSTHWLGSQWEPCSKSLQESCFASELQISPLHLSNFHLIF